MSIIVVCPGCRKSFKVNDKFAGKSGPCPSCKRTLQVPEKSQEVTVHAPTEFGGGGRTKAGKLAIEPVAFAPAKLQPVMAVILVAAVLTVLAITWVGGRTKLKLFDHLIVAAIGLLAVSPPLVVAAYSVLRDDELEPYRGKELYLRATLCALAYAALWGLFSLLVSRGLITGELWTWLYVAPPFVLAGGLFAMATLDLDFGDCLFHYGFYLVAIMVLRWAAGMKWVWDVTS
jgi:hypothetical protein